MSIKASIAEIDLDIVCDECDSNEIVSMDYDNQKFEEALSYQITDGWLFKSYKDYREMFCFCSEECFKDWLVNNKDTADKFKPAKFGAYSAEFTEDVVDVLG